MHPASKSGISTRFSGETAEMLHVWMVENPSGVFGEDMTPQTLLKALNATGQ